MRKKVEIFPNIYFVILKGYIYLSKGRSDVDYIILPCIMNVKYLLCAEAKTLFSFYWKSEFCLY